MNMRNFMNVHILATYVKLICLSKCWVGFQIKQKKRKFFTILLSFLFHIQTAVALPSARHGYQVSTLMECLDLSFAYPGAQVVPAHGAAPSESLRAVGGCLRFSPSSRPSFICLTSAALWGFWSAACHYPRFNRSWASWLLFLSREDSGLL